MDNRKRIGSNGFQNFLFLIGFGMLFFPGNQAFSQNPLADSVLQVWHSDTHSPANRSKALNSYIWNEILFRNPDEALIYADSLIEFATGYDERAGIVKGYNVIGVANAIKGNYPVSLKSFLEALRIAETTKNPRIILECLGNISNVYREMGDLENTHHYLSRTIEMQESLADTTELANSYGNMAGLLNEQNRYDEALIYAKKGEKLAGETLDERAYARLIHNIALIYEGLNKTDSALDYHVRSLAARRKINDIHGVISSSISVGRVLIKQGKFAEGRNTCGSVEQEVKKFNSLYLEGKFCECMYLGNNEMGNYKTALDYYRRLDSINRQLVNESNQKEVLASQFQYEMEKQHAADSLQAIRQHEADMMVQEQKSLEYERKIDRRNNILWFSVLGILLISGFAWFLFNRYKVTQAQKVIIENQHHELEEKNQEIRESINYAERIQQAVLPEIPLKQLLGDQAFLLYQPKDVVSGDFYWWERHEDHIIIAAADCTGHGVPGGFMSMLGTIFLNEIFNSKKLYRPGEILDELNRLMQITLRNKFGETIKDGMDISMASINIKSRELTWAGANNPVYIVQGEEDGSSREIKIIKGDRKPIGFSEDVSSFTMHSVQLEKGDAFYLFSDGYADQFGGPRNKKFGYKRFRELLTEHCSQPMDQQHRVLEETLKNWMNQGSDEQIDDICVIGVRVS